MHIYFSQFEGLALRFDPSKADTEFALLVLNFIKRGSQDPISREVAGYFIEQLTEENGRLQ